MMINKTCTISGLTSLKTIQFKSENTLQLLLLKELQPLTIVIFIIVINLTFKVPGIQVFTINLIIYKNYPKRDSLHLNFSFYKLILIINRFSSLVFSHMPKLNSGNSKSFYHIILVNNNFFVQKSFIYYQSGSVVVVQVLWIFSKLAQNYGAQPFLKNKEKDGRKD